MNIATWNVNSIRVRLDQLCAWLTQHPVDVLALQETKCEDDQFPHEALQNLGYHLLYTGQKSYNGVAILAKKPMVQHECLGYFASHEQKRFLAAEYNGCLIVNVYVPNGQSLDSEKYQYKLVWLNELYDLLKLWVKQYKKIIVLGDFNIAPESIDHSDSVKDQIMISSSERQVFDDILQLGFHDSFRIFCKAEKEYSWWDYRARAFLRNFGYRIDHILVSNTLLADCLGCSIDRSLRGLEQPSDHAPVVLTVRDQ